MTGRRRRRIWSEHVPIAELAGARATLDALAARGIQLLAAVQPKDEPHVRALIEAAAERSLSIGLWPLLDDARGRWLHPGNARAFAEWIDRLLAIVDAHRLRVDTVVLDLEPPIFEVRALLDGRARAARSWLRRPLDAGAHAALVEALRARGVEVLAAAVPCVLAPGGAARGWQRALGTPIDGVAYSAITAMLYSSLLEGYSRGRIGRADARAILASGAARARARFGDRASASLGAVGTGALGDERVYRGVDELIDDAAIARAAGIDDLALFDLTGVLARPPIERWLDALADAEPLRAPMPRTLRARALVASLWAAGVALDAACRLADR